jgi:ketosteroid isomerase-like protein
MTISESREAIDADVAGAFVERWTAIWRDHDGQSWPDLLHEECVLRNPIGELRRGDLPGYMAGLVASIAEHQIRPLRWGATDDGVLIEWVMTGNRAGTAFEIHGADRFSLRDGRAVEGVAYFDPRALLEAAANEASTQEDG